MSYRRIITAALADTKSQFRMAEALATDIPAKRRGPTAKNEQSVTEHLEAAQAAIISAGGEPRSLATLADHRLTAIWAQDEEGEFVWVPDTSYTAHNLARGMGLTREAFTELAPADRSIDALRNIHAPAPTSSPARAHSATNGHNSNGHAPGPKFLEAGGLERAEMPPPSWDVLSQLLTEFTRRLTTVLADLTSSPPARTRNKLLTQAGAAEEMLATLRSRLDKKKVPVA